MSAADVCLEEVTLGVTLSTGATVIGTLAYRTHKQHANDNDNVIGSWTKANVQSNHDLACQRREHGINTVNTDEQCKNGKDVVNQATVNVRRFIRFINCIENVNVNVNSRFVQRIIAKSGRTRKDKFSDHNENSQKKVAVLDLEGSLVTSSRSSGQPQKRPDDRTSNAGVVVRTADGSRRTAGAADEQYVWGST